MKWNSTLYNNDHSFVFEYGKDVVSLLNPTANERILDVGCGLGQLTSEISEIANEVIGIDNSPEMIADATSKFSNVTFKVADATTFSSDKPFDAIFSNATLHSVLAYELAVKNIFKHLKKDGRFVAEFGGKGNVETIVNELRKSLAKRGYVKQSNLEQWYFPSIGEYASVLETNGFKVNFAQHFNRPTELASSTAGIKNWISMFALNFFNGVTEQDTEIIKNEVQENIKEQCYHTNKWYADYKRIRIVAVKN